MTNSLTALVITTGNSTRAERLFKRLARQSFSKDVKIDYALASTFDKEGRKKSELDKYDFVIMSGESTAYFMT